MSGKDLYVVLGCYGRRTDDFISCSSVKNRILKVDLELDHYEDMMDYFEGCRLFDKPMFDFNAIRNFLQTMQSRFDQLTRPLWTKNKIDLYQNFTITHRACGTFIWLDLADAEETEPKKEPDRVRVKSTALKISKPQYEYPRAGRLKLIKP